MNLRSIFMILVLSSKSRFVKSTGEGDVRLTGGDGYRTGTVEIYHDFSWGTVCDDDWDMNDARVVCRQLELGPAITYRDEAYFGSGHGRMLLAEVACFGTEYRLDQCQLSGWNNHNCDSDDAAGVECSYPLYPTTSMYWTAGSVRLRGGSQRNEGRVEVFWESDWYTVCDDSWDILDARVVCYQLGYPGASTIVLESGFGDGDCEILLDDVWCEGYETNLLECSSDGPFNHDCTRNEIAGVVCSTASSTISPGIVRLAGGSSHNSGRVELYYDGSWGTLCDDNWNNEEANVICRQLGFAESENVYYSAFFGQGFGPILQYLECTGNEYQWTDCFFNDWGTSYCSHDEDAGVTCKSGDYTSEGDIRLIGASSENEGRVEIYHDGTWGTVCDDNWDINDAEVVCNQLGFPGALLADDNAYFGEGSGPILLDDVSCNGDEHYLTDCRHGGWYSNDCGHVEDAGVICNIPSFHYPRLVNGDKWYEGRVEVWNGYQWTKFCSDEGLRDNEADVICKELGFDGVDYVIYSHRFGEGKAPPSDVYYSCTSYEDSLSQCDNFFRSEYYCTSSALRCKYNHLLPVGAIVGTTIGVVISIILCSVCFLAIYNRSKARKNRRRNPPNVTVISGSTNQAGPTVHFAAQPAVPPTSGNEQAPPSYNDVVNNPGFYPVAYPGTYGLPGVQNPYKAQLHSPVGASEVQYSTENPIP